MGGLFQEVQPHSESTLRSHPCKPPAHFDTLRWMSVRNIPLPLLDRHPVGLQCVWAGRVRWGFAAINRGHGTERWFLPAMPMCPSSWHNVTTLPRENRPLNLFHATIIFFYCTENKLFFAYGPPAMKWWRPSKLHYCQAILLPPEGSQGTIWTLEAPPPHSNPQSPSVPSFWPGLPAHMGLTSRGHGSGGAGCPQSHRGGWPAGVGHPAAGPQHGRHRCCGRPKAPAQARLFREQVWSWKQLIENTRRKTPPGNVLCTRGMSFFFNAGWSCMIG